MALRKNSKSFIKWSLYAVILIILYALQTTPHFLEIGKIKPFLMLPLAVCISLYESEIGSGVFGLITGFLWDFSSGKIFGFYGIVIMICCVTITLLSMYLVRVNIINAVLTVTAVCLILSAWDFVFYYLIWGYENVMLSFWQLILSSLYTVFFAPFFYLVVRRITCNYSDTVRN